MAIPARFKGRFIYQFTHLQNLADILRHGLLSYNEKESRGIGHISIADSTIQARRARTPVTCGPGGFVHDYVPFYFCSRSSMLLSVVNAKNVDQLFLIYLAVPIDILDRPEGVFTNASANTEIPPDFFADVSHLKDLNWTCIDSKKWSMPSDAEKQARMAEGLVHRHVLVSEIDHIIAWNGAVKKEVERIYGDAGIAVPKIQHDGYQGRYFYFMNFYEGGKVSIVTGPMCRKTEYEATVKDVNARREEKKPANPRFSDVGDAVEQLGSHFGLLPELQAIETLETDNKEHHESVGNHTKRVVEKLLSSANYIGMQPREKGVVALAAYLHDIGKAKSPQEDGKQKADPDHPVRGLRLMARILVEEFANLSAKDIRQLALLVCYHDLIGDVIGKGREKDQIVEVVRTVNDFDMLAALSIADVSSLIPSGKLAAVVSPHTRWLNDIRAGFPELREWVVANVKKAE